MEDGLKLAVKALIKSIGEKFSAERLDVTIISKEKRKFTKLPKHEIEKLLNEARKK